ncbi:hypothetical protein GUITHDRAFT_146477 [Guillardia theta CCMP2712]|uniref:Uncharacterized protein n=1 Tax=Guillardia theta (strain CCMP2712) TaxID=905079 RepID=L1IHP7_GUITC|nr:hypothetical protein GUITHDRAFT_146477 [Guillardia theta CCMP2712]EKX35459.1 hypothetical protein GUITHDRAFT_146477 [Guillardia theta CCMP2712]|eukprot:XP_005822439.1 hypothetical protein GUITHDRAFT_146477 [Guillardia theta CCMP2712]
MQVRARAQIMSLARRNVRNVLRALLAALSIALIGFVYRRRKQILESLRTGVNNFHRVARNINDLLFSSSSLASGLAKDLRDYIYGDKQRTPESLRRLILLLSSKEVQQTLHGTAHGLLSAFFAAKRYDEEHRKEGGQDLIHAVLDKLMSEEGREYSVAVLRVLSRDVLMAYLSSEKGGREGGDRVASLLQLERQCFAAREKEEEQDGGGRARGELEGGEITLDLLSAAGRARADDSPLSRAREEIVREDAMGMRPGSAGAHRSGEWMQQEPSRRPRGDDMAGLELVLEKLLSPRGQEFVSSTLERVISSSSKEMLPMILDRVIAEGGGGGEGRATALETVLLWISDEQAGPAARKLIQEVMRDSSRSAGEVLLQLWSSKQGGAKSRSRGGRARMADMSLEEAKSPPSFTLEHSALDEHHLNDVTEQNPSLLSSKSPPAEDPDASELSSSSQSDGTLQLIIRLAENSQVRSLVRELAVSVTREGSLLLFQLVADRLPSLPSYSLSLTNVRWTAAPTASIILCVSLLVNWQDATQALVNALLLVSTFMFAYMLSRTSFSAH